MEILVDSSVWIDYFNGVANARTDYLDEILGRAPIAVADLVVLEVLQGFTDEKEWETAHAALRKFRTYDLNDSDLVSQSTVHQRLLRSKGALLPTAVDCLVATFCIRRNLALLHSNPGFEPFERYLGLKLPDPGTPI
ncbi:MAG TPA: PIN domain-containing protein [Thermoanaerobaculia bacterium]|nr:PIN domain-containing protein [Thermoanaerobaculia bacterium]